MGSERFNQALLSLDMPSWAYIGNGVQLLTDGDMALAGTANYTAGNSATLSKQSGAPGYTQCLRIAFNGVANPYAVCNSFVQTVGRVYRARGVVRGDGVNGRLWLSDSGGPGLFQGTTSTTWQPFDVTYVAAGGALYLFNLAASGYAEITAIVEELAPASTRNLGTLGGSIMLGTDGYTAGAFPTQVFPHGMKFLNSRALTWPNATGLTFSAGGGVDLPFSLELLVDGDPAVAGGILGGVLAVKSNAAAGLSDVEYYFSNAASRFYFLVCSGTTVNNCLQTVTIPAYYTPGRLIHVIATYDASKVQAGLTIYVNGADPGNSRSTAGVYPGMAPNGGVFRVGGGAGLTCWTGPIFNSAVYPFVLQPGEVAQLYRQRLGLLQKGF